MASASVLASGDVPHRVRSVGNGFFDRENYVLAYRLSVNTQYSIKITGAYLRAPIGLAAESVRTFIRVHRSAERASELAQREDAARAAVGTDSEVPLQLHERGSRGPLIGFCAWIVSVSAREGLHCIQGTSIEIQKPQLPHQRIAAES